MIHYETLLNEAQYAAVTCDDKAVLAVAGAGSGKTRTIVYRLAWLLEHGFDPQSMLLLTFTRKAAKEMLQRADNLLMQDTSGVIGGTFHSFAYRTLKIWKPAWLNDRPFTLLDPSDALTIIQECKKNLRLGEKDRSFPKIQTIQTFLSKARNKEQSINDILQRDAYQLLPYADDMAAIGIEYQKYRHDQAFMDYDDLLFELETLLKTNAIAAQAIHARFQYLMVDEYQDTNPVQARIVQLLANMPVGPQTCQVMAVGDEAQSIYAFRGSTIRNILDFPKQFPNTRIIRLEENFRSTAPVLAVANTILANAQESFHKTLFTKQEEGRPVFFYTPYNDREQAEMVGREIVDLFKKYAPEEIAVLFRSSFHSYFVEATLNRKGIPFRKFGGLKFLEAAHIKDCLAFARLIINPLDLMAFGRIAQMHPGIGAKTVEKMFAFVKNADNDGFSKFLTRFPSFYKDIVFIDGLRDAQDTPEHTMNNIIEYFQPMLEKRYTDDWPQRKQSLEEFAQVAGSYTTLEDFLAEIVLDPTSDESEEMGKVVLSTIHSAKGLEWDAVLLIDCVRDRFPSRHAYAHQEDLEEERRLMYVACTRARKELHIYSPKTLFSRMDQCDYEAAVSDFVEELDGLPPTSFYPMGDNTSKSYDPDQEITPKKAKKKSSGKKRTCHHKIFGDGVIEEELDPLTVRVKFPQFGVKVIRKEYLDL